MNFAMASRATGLAGQYFVAVQPSTIPFAHRKWMCLQKEEGRVTTHQNLPRKDRNHAAGVCAKSMLGSGRRREPKATSVMIPLQ